MSFYNHPFFQQQQQQQRRGYPAFVPSAPTPAPAFNFYTAPPVPAPSYTHPYATPATDYEAEERAALAHLQAIQHRRRLAEAAEIEREHNIQQQQQREFEAEVAKHRFEAVQRQREAEVRAMIEREARKERATAIILERQRVQALERERENLRRQAYLKAVQRDREEKIAQHVQAKRERCAERCARRVERNEDNGAEDFSKFMRMLGINLGETKAEEEEKKVEVPKTIEPTPKPADSTPAFPDNINTLLNHFLGLDVVPISGETPATPSPADNRVPQGLNEFLSRFGLEFQPLDADKEIKGTAVAVGEKAAEKEAENVTPPAASTPAPVATPAVAPTSTVTPPTTAAAGPSATSKKAPYELNDFLSRFGCEIDASTYDKFFNGGNEAVSKHDSAPSTSTAESQAELTPANAQTEAPLTTYLNQVADLPPFVRDILSNVELAFADSAKKADEQSKPELEYQGKGKGVAPGEKSTPPKPTTTPLAKPDVTPLDKLNEIAHDLYLTTESFTFPSTLSFSSATSDNNTPQLLFNKTNSSYHAQAHKLLQLLLAADGISSGGDKDVRSKRKEIVRRVEGEIEELERKRDEIWRQLSEGEIQHQEVDSRSSSETGSVAGDSEEVEHVEHAEVEGDAKGFEVPAAEEVITQAVETPKPVDVDVAEKVSENASETKHQEEKENKEEDKKSVTIEEVPDKEDGYELL